MEMLMLNRMRVVQALAASDLRTTEPRYMEIYNALADTLLTGIRTAAYRKNMFQDIPKPCFIEISARLVIAATYAVLTTDNPNTFYTMDQRLRNIFADQYDIHINSFNAEDSESFLALCKDEIFSICGSATDLHPSDLFSAVPYVRTAELLKYVLPNTYMRNHHDGTMYKYSKHLHGG